MFDRGRLLGRVAPAFRAASCALAGITIWAAADVGFVLVTVTPRTSFPLVLLSLVLSGVIALASSLVVWGLARSVPARASRGSFVAAFTLGGLIVLGTAANRSYLPGPYHPISLITDLLIAAVLVATALVLSWPLHVTSGARRWGYAAAAIWVVLFAVAASDLVRTGSATGGRLNDEGRSSPGTGGGRNGRDRQFKNVLMVVIDSLRADSLESSLAIGSAPSLARIARGGTKFATAYAQSSWTKPSVASLLTGQYPQAHGAEERGDALPDEVTTLPEILSGAGYRTGIFSANPWVSPTFGFGQGVAYFIESDPGGDPSRLLAFVRAGQAVEHLVGAPVAAPVTRLRQWLGLLSPHRTNCQRDEEIVSVALSWLRANRQVPFFAYLHLMSTHLPYEPVPGGSKVDRARQLAAQRGRSTLMTGEQDMLRDDYNETIALVDGTINRLSVALQRLGLYDRTLILVTADHGDEIYEHSHLGHGKTLYPEVVRVPLLVSLPGVVPPETVRGDPISGVDILPTILSLLGLPARPGGPGRALRFDPSSEGTRSVGDVYLSLRRQGGLSAASVISGGFQYVESKSLDASGKVVRELYDLRTDAGAAHNIWQSGSPLASRMAARLRSLRAGGGPPPRRGAEINDQTRERLRSLGYVD